MSQLHAQIRGSDQDAPCRSGQGRGSVPAMPLLIPAELSAWMEERHVDLHDRLMDGDLARVLELTSKRMVDITGGMMPLRARVINARYGLRGVRVGEASHPDEDGSDRRAVVEWSRFRVD